MQARPFLIGMLLTIAVAFCGRLGSLRGGNGCCAHCGCDTDCQKICRLECTTKKITTVCWGVESEDFCLPCPSKPGCAHQDVVCDACDPKGPDACPKLFYWREWIPNSSAKMFTRKKLMKRTVTKSVPSYNWVVEDVCPNCEAGLRTAEVPDDALIPPPPVGDTLRILSNPPAPASESR